MAVTSRATTSCCTRTSPAPSPRGSTCSTDAVRCWRRPTGALARPASEFPWFHLGCGRQGPRFHAGVLTETPRWPSAYSGGSARRARCQRSISSPRMERRRTRSGCRRTSCAPCSRRTPYGRAWPRPARRRPPVLRPPGTAAPGRTPRARGPGARTAAAQLLSRYPAHGLLGAGGADGTFDRIAPTNSAPGPARRDALRRGAGRVWCARPSTSRVSAASALSSPRSSRCCRRRRGGPSVAFIAPFDSLLSDDQLVASLFDFDYVWEGFSPPQAPLGWYVPDLLR